MEDRIVVYVDIRGSTKIKGAKKKSDIYNSFYKKMRNIKVADTGLNVDKIYYSGDGVILITKLADLDTKNILKDFTQRVSIKMSEFEDDNNMKVGAGISFGAMESINVPKNGKTDSVVAGTAIDISAKSSDIANKGNGLTHRWIAMGKNSFNIEGVKNEILIEKLDQIDFFRKKKTGKNKHFRFDWK